MKRSLVLILNAYKLFLQNCETINWQYRIISWSAYTKKGGIYEVLPPCNYFLGWLDLFANFRTNIYRLDNNLSEVWWFFWDGNKGLHFLKINLLLNLFVFSYLSNPELWHDVKRHYVYLSSPQETRSSFSTINGKSINGSRIDTVNMNNTTDWTVWNTT